MTLRVISSAIPSLTQNTDILILTPKSHDVSILTVKKIDSSDVFN